MSSIKISKIKNVSGAVTPPPDKSISHRAVMLGAIAKGRTCVKNFLNAEDCLCTVKAFMQMGIDIKTDKEGLSIEGKGLNGLKEPKGQIYLGNSGTSMRLLLGILAGQPFSVTLTGDDSLSNRPMKRVAEPLRLMGADIKAKPKSQKEKVEEYPPITIKGGKLKPIDCKLPVASAQVKSAILLAGLYADGLTHVTEPVKSRDHTERMLNLFGAKIKTADNKVSISGIADLKATEIRVPSDISSAAFFMVLASVLKDSKITIRSTGINPTRAGILEVLKKMGGKIDIQNTKDDFEPAADLVIEGSPLVGVTIDECQVPGMIDEIPIIMVAAAMADGETIINGLAELRVKETDRINSMVGNLKMMGLDIETRADAVIINGPCKLRGADVNSFGDHRTAMSMIVAGLLADGTTTVHDTDCIATSFPDFMNTVKSLNLT